jgi:hypothetical protein
MVSEAPDSGDCGMAGLGKNASERPFQSVDEIFPYHHVLSNGVNACLLVALIHLRGGIFERPMTLHAQSSATDPVALLRRLLVRREDEMVGMNPRRRAGAYGSSMEEEQRLHFSVYIALGKTVLFFPLETTLNKIINYAC